MLTLAGSRRTRFATFCALYFAQGVPWGFVSVALVSVLAERGLSAEETGGLVALALLPWTFKIIWGPMIDTLRLPAYGQRRPWIVLAQFLMAATLLATFGAGNVSEEAALGILGAIFFTHNCFASLQDVATDALAVDLLEDDERGRVNGFMWGSKLLGISVGGAGMGTVLAHWSLASGMRVMAGVIVLIALLPLLIPERAGDKRFPWSRPGDTGGEEAAISVPSTNPLRVARELLRAFSLRTTFLALFVAYLAFVAEGFAIPINAELFTQRAGWSAETYAQMQGLLGTIGKLLGAVGGGFLCDRLGCRRMIVVGILITSATFIGFTAASGAWASGGRWLAVYFLLLETGLACTSVSLFALFMNISWTTAAATQFTLYMTVLNMGNATGPMLTRLGLNYEQTFLCCAGLAALPLLVVPWLRPHVVAERKAEALALTSA